MKHKKILLGFTVFGLGFLGVLLLLTMNISLPEAALEALNDQFTPDQIRYLLLVNPTILLFVATVTGTILYQRVYLTVPIIECAIGINNKPLNISSLIKYGVLGGAVAGILLLLTDFAFRPLLSPELLQLNESVQPTLAVKLLYGGITEEILLRFGLMTFSIWLISRVLRSLKPTVYWLGLIFAALIFAVGHFPIVYQTIGQPSPTLLIYIIIGNSLGGLIFGWLYWKKGLECAFLAHICTHVVLLTTQ